MSESADGARARLSQLVDAARRIADPEDRLGQRARELLPGSTGLSPEGVAYALDECLEAQPKEEEIQALCARARPAPHCHVLLSANVFTAAHRAIALALASSPRVSVRPSRREPHLPRLLADASGGAFRIVEDLAPSPGDHVWAFGTDETLASLRGELPAGVVLHAHGPGIGVAVVQPGALVGEALSSALQAAATALARDVVPFDQHGCLSPRITLFLGGPEAANGFAQALASELAAWEQRIPRGEPTAEERADEVLYRGSMLYAAELYRAGKGFVGALAGHSHLLLAPVGRNMHVVPIANLAQALGALGPLVATVGYSGPPALGKQIRREAPRVRVVPLGRMQRPRFDGPVDLRGEPEGEVL